MSKSSLGDTTILNETMKTANERGFQQLAYVLPSGRKVVSEWIDPNQLKGGVFIQWCNVVRDQDEADIAEREAKEEQAIAQKRQRQLTSPAPSTEHVPVRNAEPDKYVTGSEDDFARTSPALSKLLKEPSVLERQRPPALPDDPTDLAKQKLAGLRIQLAEVQDQLSELSAEERKLQSAIDRWSIVLASLTGPSVAQLSELSERPRPGAFVMVKE